MNALSTSITADPLFWQLVVLGFQVLCLAVQIFALCVVWRCR